VVTASSVRVCPAADAVTVSWPETPARSGGTVAVTSTWLEIVRAACANTSFSDATVAFTARPPDPSARALRSSGGVASGPT
jgi:hypothetical protein